MCQPCTAHALWAPRLDEPRAHVATWYQVGEPRQHDAHVRAWLLHKLDQHGGVPIEPRLVGLRNRAALQATDNGDLTSSAAAFGAGALFGSLW